MKALVYNGARDVSASDVFDVHQGGQVEMLRAPFGDFSCLKLPDDAQDEEATPRWPTGWHALDERR